MLGIVLFSLFITAETGELDAAGLRQAMEAAVQSGGDSLAGRKFRIVSTFTDERSLKYQAFKRVARWRYDRDRRALVTTLSLGEITDKNFDAFKTAGLDTLPPLQSLYFDVDTRSVSAKFRSEQRDGYTLTSGFDTHAASFGLAIPYKEGGPSGLPEGFEPLVIGQTSTSGFQASTWARAMSVVFEGEITALARQGQVFCGAYRGQLATQHVTGETPMRVQDKQCFVTATIHRIRVLRDGRVLADWRRAAPPKAPD